MDVLLIQGGIVVNIAAVESMAQANSLYGADYTIVEKTGANAYHPGGEPLNPGDSAP